MQIRTGLWLGPEATETRTRILARPLQMPGHCVWFSWGQLWFLETAGAEAVTVALPGSGMGYPEAQGPPGDMPQMSDPDNTMRSKQDGGWKERTLPAHGLPAQSTTDTAELGSQ